MKVGSVGYGTVQGLGLLLKDFYDNGIVTDVLQVSHRTFENHYDWYPNGLRVDNLTQGELYEWIRSMDVMFFFETAFFPWLIEFCQHNNVKTMMMPMYECTPKAEATAVDYIINPSMLDQQYYPQGYFTPVPIPGHIEWRQREKAEVFVHNSGHGGLKGRNGTKELLDSINYIQSDIKLIIRSQDYLEHPNLDDQRVVFELGTKDKEDLYSEGDVFVFPEKFNGLSLPLQEAYASGMAICCNDRFPMNTWLDPKYMIPVSHSQFTKVLGNQILSLSSTPEDIATTIDGIYGADITEASLFGQRFRREHSWPEMKQEYLHHVLKCKMGKK